MAGILSTAASSPRFGDRRLVASAALIELAAAAILVANTDAAFSPFVLAAASPLVMATLSDRGLLVALSGLAAIAMPVATLADPGRGIPVTIHATAVVLAVPWLAYGARQSGSESPTLDATPPVVTEADRALLNQLEAGLTYAQIAERSGDSLEKTTVRIARLYRRLGAANKQEAIRFGRPRQAPRPEEDIPRTAR